MVMVGSANTKRGLWGRGLGRVPWEDETEIGPAGKAVCLTQGIQQAWGKCKSIRVSLDTALEPINPALDGAESASVSVSKLLGLRIHLGHSFILHSLTHLFIPQLVTMSRSVHSTAFFFLQV